MAKKVTSHIPEESIGLFSRLISQIPDVELKGASMPYVSRNGHMFAFLDKKGQLGLRLPSAERELFIKKYKTALCEAHGTVLKEYVLVPDKLFKKTAELADYFSIAFEYVSSLKPKASKRK